MMQWIVGTLLTMLVVNGVGWGVQSAVFVMAGGQIERCEGVPTLLCGPGGEEAPFYATTKRKDERKAPTGFGGIFDATKSYLGQAGQIIGILSGISAMDYLLFSGDPTGQDPVAGYLAIVGYTISFVSFAAFIAFLLSLGAVAIQNLPGIRL